ncbi:MAG: hypothetical protein Q9210_006967, partial [Variospora velana]
MAPLAASVISIFPSEDDRAKGLWTIVQMAKSNGLGWLMRTTASTKGNQIEGSVRVDVKFEELPVSTPEELKPLGLDAGRQCHLCGLVHFEESDLRKSDASKDLQRLNPLVEPLAAATESGQTLVFSSIGSLHRLPLHALTINGGTLIE